MEKSQSIIRPLQAPLQLGVSVINENPIGVLEKLGKYEFIYDYKVPNFWDNLNMVAHTKEGGSNANMIATSGSNDKMIAPSGFWSGQFPQPVKINSEAQVGFFSKGNIVNVLRFDGNNAIIENINYKVPDPTVVKTVWGELLGSVLNKKEFSVPKDYLRKADDTLEPTLLTGINYGANMKPPTFIMPPVKPIPYSPVTQTILEENASFVLNRDFQYVSHYGSSYCSPDGLCTADMSPKFSTLKAGTKVTGRLFSESQTFKTSMDIVMPKQFLAVKGYGDKGSINIPVEYLTKEVPTNSGAVVPAKNDNKNLLMIVGAFLVGYVVFSKGKSE